MCSPRIMSEVYERIGRRANVSRRALFGVLGGAAVGATLAPALAARAYATPADATSIVDLTHVLTPQFPVWPGSRQFEMHTVASITTGNGSTGSLGPIGGSAFYLNELRYEEHTGTHVDAPAHASVDGITVEQIPAADLIAPIAVVDIAARAATDNDTLLTRQDLLEWEERHGRLSSRCIVAMHSGWESRVAAPGAFTNQDALGVQHTPGFAPEAVDFLVHERDIVAIGSDTLSIDAGRSTTYGAHLAALGAGKYGIEVLANLSTIPASGATCMVGAPTHAGGSGGPARVLALF
ncbi:cyclase family protein [Rhodococcus sp. NPDC058521]|uniref:cyclase family protein n=1 Tax=Rhodococcus sp. NPDC058521 TaxID=3346536 RepID=UPI0036676B5D